MSEFIAKFFIDPKTLPTTIFGDFQVLFLGSVYGYVLFSGSNLISNGSEYLLLVPALAGIVGSVVLPILGAVPDGAIVLFSGMGPNAQEQLSIGVGALAGSTIMLLTIPWALSIIAGRVDLDDEGNGNYKRPKHIDAKQWSKLNPPNSFKLFRSGVVVGKEVSFNARMMLLTASIYLIIQIPAFVSTGTKYLDQHADLKKVSSYEKKYAFVGLICCIVAFLGYLYWNIQRTSQVKEDIVDEIRVQAIRRREISLSGIMGKTIFSSASSLYGTYNDLMGDEYKKMEVILRPFFLKYDVNHDGRMDKDEIRLFFKDLNEDITHEEMDKWFAEADKDNSGYIEFRELVEDTIKYLQNHNDNDKEDPTHPSNANDQAPPHELSTLGTSFVDNDDGEDEEEEIPQDLLHLSVAQQQRAIKLRAAWMMSLGTLLILIFSDPMVDIMSEIGKRSGIPSFYISFMCAPLASNASELIAAYNYALKKTTKTINISFSALLGAACMNNTFCLGIFMGLLYFTPNGLVWVFSAETIAILFVEILMGVFALRTCHRLVDALFVFSLYPLSLLLVAFLENVVGLD